MKNVLILLFAFGFFGCSSNQEKEIIGSWTNGAHTFEFMEGGNAYWLIDLGESRTDTFKMKYRFNPSKKPMHLDLTGFDKGLLINSTLLGIVEFTDENTFRFDCEAKNEAVKDGITRPGNFRADQTQSYTRVE